MWGCLGLGVMMCLGICALTALLTPLAFRQLPEEWQTRLAGRIPLLEAFLPTRDPALEAIPTLDPARATAAAAFAFATTPDPNAALAPNVTPSAVLGIVPTPTPPLVVGSALQTRTAQPQFQPTATTQPLPERFYAENARREAQNWNNCGPANLVQAMRVLGVEKSQREVADWLKPNDRDSNVSPWQMVLYTNQFSGLRAVTRVNGSVDLLKRLVYAGFGVVIETGLIHHDDGSWLGHYVTVVGWDNIGDESGGYLYGLDSFESNGPDGKGVHEHYADLDERWKHFNRVYIVVYRPEDEGLVRSILGTAWDETQNVQEALERAWQEAQFNPNDPFAWFNVGTNYTHLGQYNQAAVAFDRARTAGNGLPWRMLWYQFTPFKAYYQVGDYATVRDLANAVIAQTRTIEETFYYRGLASVALGIPDQARTDLEFAARLNGNFAPAQTALAQIQSGVQPVPETF